MSIGLTQDEPFSVTALAEGIRRAIEGAYAKVYVEGEISGWRTYPSGHSYFTLKDENAQVPCVMFASYFARCRVRAMLKDGAKVLLYAKPTVYAQRGNFQLVVLAARPVGEGELMARYLALKEKLGGEGLFDSGRKRPLPAFPRRIGLITSPAGAVVHDVCRVLMRRFPLVEIRIHPATVQGDAAAPTLVAGLRFFNACADWRADVLIVARGGGSFEDLFCFNDEALVRAVASSGIPVVSAVGHETDFTLCDFAADLRAGTPSMAAELVVPKLSDVRKTIAESGSRALAALRGRYELSSQRLDGAAESLSSSLNRYEFRLRERLATLRGRFLLAGSSLPGRCDNLAYRVAQLSASMAQLLQLRQTRAEGRISELSEKLRLLSPYSVLSRGYSLTTDAAGAVVRDAAAVRPGQVVRTRLAAGTFESVVK